MNRATLEALVAWALLAVTFALCAMNFYTEDKLLAARLGPDGFLSMSSPDYARIYYHR